jgi:arylsulfatase
MENTAVAVAGSLPDHHPLRQESRHQTAGQGSGGHPVGLFVRGKVRCMGPVRHAISALLLGLVSCSAQPPRLLLLISVDTLRADRVGAYGSGRDLTPNIDALARESGLFSAAYAPTSHTLPSVSALLTGLYPQQVGIRNNESTLPDSAPTLAKAFRAKGWRTEAVVSNWVLRKDAGLAAGFEHYDDRMPQLEASRPLPERIAADTTDAALDALDRCTRDGAEKCFLWVHYQDPHGPYTPPAGRRARHLEREREAPDGRRHLALLPGPFGLGGIPSYQYLDGQHEVAFYRAGYDAEIAYLDEEIGRLLAALPERGLDSSSVVVFTADHGEALGEDDYWFAHGELLSEALVRVPLLIRAPGVPPGERSDVASLVDLYPTLLALFFGATPDPRAPGRHLLAPDAAESASTPYLAALGASKVPRFGIVDGEFKYVVTLEDENWRGRLLQRENEDVDLTAPAPHIAAALRQKLEAMLARYPASEEDTARDPSDIERARLRALGYIESEASAPSPHTP